MENVIMAKTYVHATGMMTRKNASMALGVQPKTMCHWAAVGVGPEPVKVRGRVFYRWADVIAFASGEA